MTNISPFSPLLATPRPDQDRQWKFGLGFLAGQSAGLQSTHTFTIPPRSKAAKAFVSAEHVLGQERATYGLLRKPQSLSSFTTQYKFWDGSKFNYSKAQEEILREIRAVEHSKGTVERVIGGIDDGSLPRITGLSAADELRMNKRELKGLKRELKTYNSYVQRIDRAETTGHAFPKFALGKYVRGVQGAAFYIGGAASVGSIIYAALQDGQDKGQSWAIGRRTMGTFAGNVGAWATGLLATGITVGLSNKLKLKGIGNVVVPLVGIAGSGLLGGYAYRASDHVGGKIYNRLYT